MISKYLLYFNVFYATITFCVFIYLLVCFIFGFMVVYMGSWTLLQTTCILMAFLFFSYCIFVFCKLPLDCNK